MATTNKLTSTSAQQSDVDKTARLVDTALEAVPVTKAFAKFVSSLTYEEIGPEVVENLKRLLLDYIGVGAFAASHVESSEPFRRAIVAFSGNASGNCTVITKGHQFLPQYASLLNAAYVHTLDFDDTYAGGALHPGASVISAALTQAEISGVDGKALLTGLAAGYEVICRLSRALGRGSYERGFHNTGTAGIFGALAAIMKIRGAASTAVEAAFGLAGSKAAGSQQFLENGGWNKRLHPGFAAHDAWLCATFVDEDIITAAKPLEGIWGFLKGYSSSPNVENVVKGLGQEWVHITTAIKPYPGCRMTHTGIDLASKWRTVKTCPIKSLRLSLSPHCWMIVGRPLPNKIHPVNIVDAQFSAYYQLAIAWLDGNETGWGVYDRIHDRDVSELLNHITIEASEELPGLSGRLEMHWEDGSTMVDMENDPVGEPSNPFTDEQILKKFRSLSIPAYGRQKSEEIIEVVRNLDQCKNTKELMVLLA